MSDVLKSRPIIYVFTTAYDPFIGGAEIAIAEVIKKLSSDFDFIIVTARLKKDLTPFEEKNKINPPTFSRGIGPREKDLKTPFIPAARPQGIREGGGDKDTQLHELFSGHTRNFQSIQKSKIFLPII